MIMVKKFLYASTFLILVTIFFTETNAQEKVVAEQNIRLNPEQIEIIKAVNDYLFSIKTAKGSFIQVVPQSSVISNGKIFLSKPGKMALKYSDPFKLDYYVDGADLVQYDHDLDQVGRAKMKNSPIRILLYDGVNLLDNPILQVFNAEEVNGKYKLYMATRDELAEDISGLFLEVNKYPLKLESINRVDNEGNFIKMNFSSFNTNIEINDEVFKFTRPKSKYL